MTKIELPVMGDKTGFCRSSHTFRNIDSGLAVFGVRGCSIEAKDCSIKLKDCSIRINHPFTKVSDCFIRVRDCSIRVY